MRTRVPLLTLFGASNELPEEEELTALYDRFLLRFVVDYIAEDFRFLRMLESQAQPERTTLTLAELTDLQEQARAVAIPSHVYRGIADIRRELNKKNIQASDRRYRQSLSLLQAHAYLEGAQEVEEKDLFFLEHVLWRDPAEHEQVRSTVRELLLGYEEEITELLYESGAPARQDQRRTGEGADRAPHQAEKHSRQGRSDHGESQAARPSAGPRPLRSRRDRAVAKRNASAILSTEIRGQEPFRKGS
ncbi:MAG: MoxR-like ATPase [Deltaproteobacteria bacterium]|nr:MoxR-like ATPase [Deltaproteobacteria bacterium]